MNSNENNHWGATIIIFIAVALIPVLYYLKTHSNIDNDVYGPGMMVGVIGLSLLAIVLASAVIAMIFQFIKHQFKPKIDKTPEFNNTDINP
ncbi:hypothetical protein [Gluconobacter cerinus]|uniref:hypothetical protein n=1 Tax=Gluconobacter cerinus TaxID=38307 RepID=UPI001B8C2F2B|nr:hypothetical protein [Gluconobacter cerinus]MBS1038112.1 hypothetical protein [Gluconobacter cerinus]